MPGARTLRVFSVECLNPMGREIMRNFVSVLTLAAGLAVTAFSMSAQASPVGPTPYAVPLSSLLATYDGGGNIVIDPTFTVANLVFHGFSYSLNSGPAPTADEILIWRWKDDVTGNFGIEITGGFADSALTPGNTDATLRYTVTSLDGATISDVHLNGDGVHTGFGSISVGESWYDAETGQLLVKGSISSDYISEGQTLDNLNFGFDFSPNTYTSISVVKDINVNAGPIGSAAISVIDQTFSQTPNTGETPEPMTLSIFGLGAAGLLFRRSRKA